MDKLIVITPSNTRGINFNKSDLKFGDIIITRNEKHGVFTGIDIFFENDRTPYFNENWNDDLIFVNGNTDLDIILVSSGETLIAARESVMDTALK